MKIERRGQLNVPNIDADGTLSFLPSLGEFTLLSRNLKHLGVDDTENRVVVGSLAGSAAWNTLYQNATVEHFLRSERANRKIYFLTVSM